MREKVKFAMEKRSNILELNERLSLGSIADAAYVCQLYDEIAKTLQLNSAAVIDFFELSIKFFDRCFGEDTTNRHADDLPSKWNAYRVGGWFKKLVITSGQSTNTTSATNGVNLINVLSMNGNVMDVLRRGNEYFKLDILLLPEKLRTLLLQASQHKKTNIFTLPSIKYIYNENLAWLTHWLTTSKDHQLTINQHSASILTLPPFHYFLILLLRYPTLSEAIFSTDIDNTNPYNKNKINPNNTIKNNKNIGIVLLLQSNTYINMLRHYFTHLLPRYKKVAETRNLTTDLNLNLTIGPNDNITNNTDSEWFLRLAVVYWMDTAVVRTNTTTYYHELSHGHGQQGLGQSRGRQNGASALSISGSGHESALLSPLSVAVIDDYLPAYPTPVLQVSSTTILYLYANTLKLYCIVLIFITYMLYFSLYLSSAPFSWSCISSATLA